MSVAEAFGRDDVRVDALRLEIRDDIVGAARGQIDVVGDAASLQRRADRQIVGIPVNDDLRVLHGLQPWHVSVQRLLAVGTELVAALRKQHVAGDDPLLLLLHFGDL